MSLKKLGGTFFKGLKKAHKVATSEKTKSTIKKVQDQGARMQNTVYGIDTAQKKKTVKKSAAIKKTVNKKTAAKKRSATKKSTTAGYNKMGSYSTKAQADKAAKFYRTEGARVKITKYASKYNLYVGMH